MRASKELDALKAQFHIRNTVICLVGKSKQVCLAWQLFERHFSLKICG